MNQGRKDRVKFEIVFKKNKKINVLSKESTP